MDRDIRTCNTCEEPMDSWYIYWWETYCHEKCLPISEAQWNKEYTDDGDDCYTEWESIYLDD